MTDNTPVRLGVVGLGRAFTLMLPTLSQHPLVRLVAATDPRPDARARFAQDFGAAVYPDIATLCADPSVQAVYIASPHGFHLDHVRCAAAAGKHILVEKPMALSIRGLHRDDRRDGSRRRPPPRRSTATASTCPICTRAL